MEIIKNWAFSLCSAAIIGSVINMILPESSTQKTFKIISNVFFLCVLLSPLAEITKIEPDELLNIDTYQDTFETGYLDDTSTEYLENKIISATKEILENERVEAKDISIKINISEENGIDINKFVLTFGYVDNENIIAEKIHKKIGIKPDIILSEES